MKQKYDIADAALNHDVIHILRDISALANEFDLNNIDHAEDVMQQVEENAHTLREISALLATDHDALLDVSDHDNLQHGQNNLSKLPTAKQDLCLPDLPSHLQTPRSNISTGVAQTQHVEAYMDHERQPVAD